MWRDVEIYTTKRRSTAIVLHFGHNEFQGIDSNLTLVDSVLKDSKGNTIQIRDLDDIAFDSKEMFEISSDKHKTARTLCMSSLMGQHLLQKFKVRREHGSPRSSLSFVRRVDRHWLTCKQQPPKIFYQKVSFS